MKKRLFYATVALFMSILSACSAISVSKLPEDPANIKPSNHNGIVYCLPKTHFDIQVTVEKTIVEPSEFFEKNKEGFLKSVEQKTPWLKYYPKKDSVYKLTSIKLIPVIVPDSSELYYAEFRRNNALFLKKKEQFTLSNGLYLKEGSMSFEDQTSDVIVDLGIKLGTLFIGGPAGFLATAQSSNQRDSSDLLIRLNIILDRIVDIQKIKKSILDGKAEEKIYNSEFSVLLTKLEQEEQELIELVRGKKRVSAEQRTFSIDPKVGSNTMFYFTQTGGISDDDIDARAVYFILEQNSLKPRLDSLLSKKELRIKSRNHGIYYRIPFHTNLKIYYREELILSEPVTIPQLGSVSFLPSKIALRSNDIQYTLDEKSGALIKFDASGEGLNPENIKKITEAVTQLSENKISSLENEIKLKELQDQLDSLNRKQR